MELFYKNISDKKLTTTSATNVLKLTPTFAGNYQVNIYYRVINAQTNITIALAWTDGSGVQTITIVPLTFEDIGSYLLVPAFINATPATAITITVTAGTANNIFVSATIQGIL